MIQTKHELLWYAKRTGVTAFVLMLGALIIGGFAGPSASGSPSNDKDKEFTRVYQHTYDEVFQASLEAIERLGMFVTAKDKDKGTIAGNGKTSASITVYFDIHIEAVNTTPETRVTINATAKGGGVCPGCKSANMNYFKDHFSTELQKVLATYH
jgi:hypothetical protein